MVKTATATTDAAPEAEGERPPICISPKSVAVDFEGQCLRQIVVRLPADFTASDLAEPSIWSRVQGDRGAALRKFDRVVLISHDEHWLWQAYVAQSGRVSVAVARLAFATATTATATVWRLMPGPRLVTAELPAGAVLLDEPAFQLMRRVVARREVHRQAADEVTAIVAGLRRGAFLDEPRNAEHVLRTVRAFLEVASP